jgi:glycolate oxidase
VGDVGRKYGFRVANVFHAGDGNLHPNILFDASQPGELERVHEAGREMLRICVNAGGTITGEHGIGMEKREFMPWIFSEDDMNAMRRLRNAFEAGDFLNPGKVFPAAEGAEGAD